jgi:uncharacterized protein YcbK (DUF882 family)
MSDATYVEFENQLIIRRIELTCSRRDFLKLGIATFTASFLPLPAFAAALTQPDTHRRLAFYNIHTGESAEICYYDCGDYCSDALDNVNHILRDYRADEVIPIDPKLLDQLYALKLKTGTKSPFHVISGYRTPATNAMLRRRSKGVARRSYHTKGKAIDIRIPGYNTHRLRNVALSLRAGGVGYYRASNFVHIDTGPVRTW